MSWGLRMITYAAVFLLICLIWFGFRYFVSIKRIDLKPRWFFISVYIFSVALFLTYPIGGHFQNIILGSFSRTEFPVFFIYLFWYGFINMGVMINWLVLHDVLLPLTIRFSQKDPDKLKRNFAKLFLIISALTIPFTAVKLVWDTHRITVNEITHSVQGIDPLTIVHIADLHADNYTDKEKMSRYVQKVNEANPDIVIFSGDLITSGNAYVESGADALAAIESTYGVYVVMGDHDYWLGTEIINHALTEKGIHVLQDENSWIQHGESKIKVTGVTELYSRQISNEVLDQLLHEDEGEVFKILASHQATERFIEKSQTTGVNQLLVGHTHGGQMRIPLLFYPLSAARAETPYVKGYWQLENLLLNVNSGLGFTLSPVRYHAPAEVTVIQIGDSNS